MIKKFILSFLAITAACWLVLAQENTLPQSIKRGEGVYSANCASCHMAAGEGLESVFPPVAKTTYLKNQAKVIGIVLNGQEGEITVNGKKYNGAMVGLSQLSDTEIADVINYISNSWGNKYPQVKPAQVKALRK